MTHPCGHAAPTRRSQARESQARRAQARGHGFKLAARVAVLAVAAAGIAGFSATHKTVTITVNDESREVTTFAGSVGGVLAQEHIDYSERDLVAPGPAASVPRDGEIVIRTARPIELVIDGES
ncbi:MAG: ubiquitin-like domain-containing protein, partial [Bifidobacteriaceae bacterium]|nr:ubiquitin-like domain-containing protein [Bifidobacteriaceae bacterium]